MPIGHQLHFLSSAVVVVATIVSLFAFVAIDSADGAGEVGIAQRAELAAVAGSLTHVALRTARARMGTGS